MPLIAPGPAEEPIARAVEVYLRTEDRSAIDDLLRIQQAEVPGHRNFTRVSIYDLTDTRLHHFDVQVPFRPGRGDG